MQLIEGQMCLCFFKIKIKVICYLHFTAGYILLYCVCDEYKS